MMASTLIWNSVYQEAEHVLGVPHEFGWRRIVLRSSLLLFGLFCAMTMPHFGVLLSLIGGFSVCLTTYFFPPLCYYMLMRQLADTRGEVSVGIDMWELTLMAILFLVGVLGTIAATWSAVVSATHAVAFTKPCYVDWGAYD